MKKVVLITNIPSSYRVDFYNLLATTDKIDFHFIFIPEKNINHKSIIWGKKENKFYNKSQFIEKNNKLAIYISLAKLLYHIKPKKIVIGGFPNYFFVILLLKLVLKFDIFCWWGGHKYSEPNTFSKRNYRKISSFFIKGCFFYSEHAASYFLKNIKNLNSSNYRIVGNNTRINSLTIIKSNVQDITNEKSIFNIITIGFQNNKNTILLLKSLKIIQSKNVDVLLKIVGDGPEIERLKKYSLDNNIENLYFIGNVPPEDVYRYLSTSDLLVHPSYHDRWPQVINEAAACGIPYLVSSKAGVINAYTKKYNKFVIFNPQDENELALKIQNLIDKPAFKNDLGYYAQKDALENDGRKAFSYFIELLA